jgi:selenocysteine lyase/cysteine desulfurase
VIRDLGDRLAEGVRHKGYQVLGERTPATGAGIVSFRKEGLPATEIVRKLKGMRIIAAPRQGWVRMSPHFYISPEDIGQVLEALD